MKSLITSWAQWALIAAAILLLTTLRRLDLLAIVAPLAVAVGYATTLGKSKSDSGQRRI